MTYNRVWLAGCSEKRRGRAFRIIDQYDGGPTLAGPLVYHIEYEDDGSQESISKDNVALGSALRADSE